MSSRAQFCENGDELAVVADNDLFTLLDDDAWEWVGEWVTGEHADVAVERVKNGVTSIEACDLDDYAALVSDDFVEHLDVPGLPATKDGMLQYFGMILAAFPDLDFVVDDLIVGDGKRVARATVTGTHQGEFMGVPARGRSIEIQLIDIMGFDDDGLIDEHWGVANMLSLLQQIGAVPA